MGRRGSWRVEGHDLDSEGVESVGHAELVGLVRMLTEWVQALEAENERLRSEIEGLHREAGRDSTNSGLPPAGDDKAAREKRAKARRKPIRVKGNANLVGSPAARATRCPVFVIRTGRSCIGPRAAAVAAHRWLMRSRSGRDAGPAGLRRSRPPGRGDRTRSRDMQV